MAGGGNLGGGVLASTFGIATALWCWRQAKSDRFGRRIWDSRVSGGLDFDQLVPKTGQLRSAEFGWWSTRILKMGVGFGLLLVVLGVVSIVLALLR